MSKTTTAGIQSVERRLHTRHRARTTVYITTPSGRKKLCRAINLSATGVFVETTNLGLRKGQQVEALAVVRILKPRIGMGIEFIDVEPPSHEVLSRWIEQVRQNR